MPTWSFSLFTQTYAPSASLDIAYPMAKYYEKDYRLNLGFYFTQVGLSCGTIK